jgi:hypothetical protein
VRYAADRVDDLTAVGLLGDVAGGPEAEALVDLVAAEMHGEDEHRALARQLLEHRLGAHAGHSQVEHGDVGRLGTDQVERGRAVTARPDQLEVVGARDRRGEPVDVDRMVVRDDHADRVVSWRHRSSF